MANYNNKIPDKANMQTLLPHFSAVADRLLFLFGRYGPQ